jgi:tRNA (guanine-N7-)-methyltransferase
MGVFFLLGLVCMDFKLRPFSGDRVPRPHNEISVPSLSEGYTGLDLEIGAGAGMHALAYARQNPSRLLVAVERTEAKFKAFESRVSRHEPLKNLVAIRDNAVSVVTHLVAPRSLDRVFILYPNPYPKESQANKRWHRMPFIQHLHECMKPGGELTIATNEVFYKDECRAWLLGLGLFKLVSEAELSLSDAETPRLPRMRTHFEKKYLRARQKIYNLVFARC